ncbi:MAG: DUF4331 family protein [Gemmatimonadales bacterium]
MKRIRLIAAGTAVAATAGFGLLVASDHRDSALLTDDRAADIADVYVFRSPANPDNVVFAMTVSGLIPPAEAATTLFDPNVLYQFKIDNDGDAVEDLVIQAFGTGSPGREVMHFRGPAAPTIAGTTIRVLPGPEAATVRVSHGAEALTATRGTLTVFAGVRDDPFFFDLVQFRKVITGEAAGFRNPGVDTFAGTNVLAIVVEVPRLALGDNPNIGVWGTTNRLQ